MDNTGRNRGLARLRPETAEAALLLCGRHQSRALRPFRHFDSAIRIRKAWCRLNPLPDTLLHPDPRRKFRVPADRVCELAWKTTGTLRFLHALHTKFRWRWRYRSTAGQSCGPSRPIHLVTAAHARPGNENVARKIFLVNP